MNEHPTADTRHHSHVNALLNSVSDNTVSTYLSKEQSLTNARQLTSVRYNR